jgi:hypothetical protein
LRLKQESGSKPSAGHSIAMAVVFDHSRGFILVEKSSAEAMTFCLVLPELADDMLAVIFAERPF